MNKQNGFGAIEIILVVVIVSLIGFMGWRLWEAQQDIDALKEDQISSKVETKKSESKTESKETDKAQIAKLVCPDGDQKVLDLARGGIEITDSIFAQYVGGCAESADVETGGGFHSFLKKSNGSWVVIQEGNGFLDCTKLTDKNFPESLVQACSGPSYLE